ncbi:MAG: hypothetical protein JNK33_03005 [Candidatus Doudnabacteria bacterium]|nr:hypothetical protein [Candidatus Doudnabacteria bacterium]
MQAKILTASKQPSHEVSDVGVPYLRISVLRLVVLIAISLGFYGMYWFYKNWQAARTISGEKLSPFWRALLSIFWIWPLFIHMYKALPAKKLPCLQRSGVMASYYIFLNLATGVVSYLSGTNVLLNILLFVLTVACFMPVIYVQHKMNRLPKPLPVHKTTKGEIAVIAIGILIAIVMFWAAFLPDDGQLTPDQQTLHANVDDLTKQYDKCSINLARRQETIDPSDQAAVAAFIADQVKCDAVRIQQNKAVDEFNGSL